MIAISILLLLPIFLIPAQAEVPPCTDGVISFNHNSTYTYYPSLNDTIGFSAPQFPQYFTCDYQIIVSEGWYAKVELTLKTDATVTKAPVAIVDALNRTEEVNASDDQGFFFTGRGGTIKLATENGNVNFGFKLRWNQYSTISQQEFNLSKSDDQPSVIKFQSLLSSFIVNAETKVAVFAKSLISDKNLLRGIVFFDGDSWNSTSLGTGLQLWNSQSQYVSSGNNMTIMNLDPNNFNPYYEAWIQDYELSKSFVQIQRSIKDKYGVNYVLDGSSGASALYNFIDGVLIELEGSGTLDVYSGTMKETNRLASYSINDSSLSLPQIFCGDFTNFVVTGGTAKFKFSYDLDSFQKTASLRRKGFIKSYMSSSVSMSFITQIDSPDKEIAKFRFNISKFDNKGDPSLTIMSLINNTWSLYKSYNPFSPPSLNDYDELNANSMKYLYTVVDGKADGLFVEFEVDQSISRGPYIFSVLVMVLLAYFHSLL